MSFKKPYIFLTSISAFLLLGLGFLLGGCSNVNKGSAKIDKSGLKGRITISGAFALYPMALVWGEEFSKIHPGVEVSVSAGGSGKGMTDALCNMVDLGMFSRELSASEKQGKVCLIPVVRDALVVLMNDKNPNLAKYKKQGMKRSDLYNIFIKGEDQDFHVYTRADACGAAQTFANYLGANQEDFQGMGINGDPGMAVAVQRDKLGIGYNNMAFAYDMESGKLNQGLYVIPLDINENGQIDSSENFYDSLVSLDQAIKEGIYPSPPARNLYFVSRDYPKDTLVRAFLKYVLTDGQTMISQLGFVPLDTATVHRELLKLDK